MRRRIALASLPVLILLVGCGPYPTPGASPSATTPSATVDPSTPPPSTPGPTPSPDVPATTAPPAVDTDFTSAQLVQLCTDETRSLAPDATYLPEQATTEWLGEVALWFVVIPKELDGVASAAICGIGGDSASPSFAMSGETLIHGVEEAREELLSGDDHGMD